MKSVAALLLALVGLTVASSSTPVSRIVTLLNNLKSKLESDLKAETDLFETYKCWYKTTTTTKTASNDAANSRIDSQKTYIKDIEAGRIEFTTERVDLEKQIAGLTKDLEAAKTMRESEKKDFEAAETEMKQAISALDGAIKTIEEGTKGSLVQKKSYMDMLSTRHEIQKAIAFASGLLDSDEQKDLHQLLNGDEPKDWKKLNKKATHKMKYTKSSGKILETLAGLKTTFEKNLKEAQAAEKAAQESYDTLSKSKGTMLDTANKAVKDMAAENGARGVSKADAQAEVDALEAQVKADTKFISEAETAFTTKQKEWDTRKELRSAEILAMSQAIAVLASDEAKDTMKESFKSQGYLFLQEFSAQSEPKQRAKCAARLVRSLASKSNDHQLSLLATSVGNEAIEKVIVKIDEIVKLKDAEEKEDLTKKQKCEVDLSDAASASRKASLAIDTATEDITRASSQVTELKGQIKEQEEKKAGLQGQIKDAVSMRADEAKLFAADKLADEKAVDLVKSAINIVKDWKNAKAALISKVTLKAPVPTAPEGILPAPKAVVATQAPHRLAATAIKVHTATQSSSKQAPQFQSESGEAPVPPPATWDTGSSYEGAGESKGIVGILELVMDDMKKDITANTADEAQAVKDFEKAKADLEGEVKATDSTIDAYTKDKASKEKTVAEKGTERSTKKGELDSQMDLYQGYKPGCDFLLVNFETRVKARQIEVDGLKKAKAILKGAKFGGSLMQATC
jgi:chromosome segregation ATPase